MYLFNYTVGISLGVESSLPTNPNPIKTITFKMMRICDHLTNSDPKSAENQIVIRAGDSIEPRPDHHNA